MFLQDYAQEITVFLTIVPPIVGSIFWSHRNLHKDLQEVKEDTKRAHDRIDQTNMRIDNTYQLILEALRKKD